MPRPPAWLVALLIVVAFAFQGTRGIWEPDEGRYTAGGLNMVDSGDWLVPTLDGEHAHLTKPPMTYWAIASSVALLGRNEWAARLPGALAFVGTGLLVFGLGRRFCPARPWLPALVYGLSLAPFMGANVVSTDVLLVFFETAAMYAFVRAVPGDGHLDRRWIRAMWLAWGLAFMTKGPPGLLPLLAMMAIVPGALVYTVSVQFLSRSVESWFNVKVDAALEGGAASQAAAGMTLGHAGIGRLGQRALVAGRLRRGGERERLHRSPAAVEPGIHEVDPRDQAELVELESRLEVVDGRHRAVIFLQPTQAQGVPEVPGYCAHLDVRVQVTGTLGHGFGLVATRVRLAQQHAAREVVDLDHVEVEHVDRPAAEEREVLDDLVADRACADHGDARRGDLLLREPVDQVVSTVTLGAARVEHVAALAQSTTIRTAEKPVLLQPAHRPPFSRARTRALSA